MVSSTARVDRQFSPSPKLFWWSFTRHILTLDYIHMVQHPRQTTGNCMVFLPNNYGFLGTHIKPGHLYSFSHLDTGLSRHNTQPGMNFFSCSLSTHQSVLSLPIIHPCRWEEFCLCNWGLIWKHQILYATCTPQVESEFPRTCWWSLSTKKYATNQIVSWPLKKPHSRPS